jgi:hypothetical protein
VVIGERLLLVKLLIEVMRLEGVLMEVLQVVELELELEVW